MNTWVVQVILLGASFALQYFVMPQWGLAAYTPEILLTACGVSAAFYGTKRALLFAILLGLALDLLLGYAYGMYLLPLVVAAILGEHLSRLVFDKPWLCALYLGVGAYAAKIFRILFAAGCGHGRIPSATDFAQGAGMAAITALAALLMILLLDRRQRADKSGRYGTLRSQTPSFLWKED